MHHTVRSHLNSDRVMSRTYGTNSPKGCQNVSGKDDENCFVPLSDEVVRNDNDFKQPRPIKEKTCGTTTLLPKICLSTSVIIIVTGCVLPRADWTWM